MCMHIDAAVFCSVWQCVAVCCSLLQCHTQRYKYLPTGTPSTLSMISPLLIFWLLKAAPSTCCLATTTPSSSLLACSSISALPNRSRSSFSAGFCRAPTSCNSCAVMDVAGSAYGVGKGEHAKHKNLLAFAPRHMPCQPCPGSRPFPFLSF